nr:hypothetical protein [Sphingobium algorifonticola]
MDDLLELNLGQRLVKLDPAEEGLMPADCPRRLDSVAETDGHGFSWLELKKTVDAHPMPRQVDRHHLCEDAAPGNDADIGVEARAAIRTAGAEIQDLAMEFVSRTRAEHL